MEKTLVLLVTLTLKLDEGEIDINDTKDVETEIDEIEKVTTNVLNDYLKDDRWNATTVKKVNIERQH